MDYQKIVYFLKVAEKLSITDAAKALFITPQALSHQIALLEQELGIQLFERSTRRIRLTETGLFCQAQYSTAKRAVDAAQQAVQQEIERINNIIRVGFFGGLPKNDLLTPTLGKLQHCSEGCQLELTSGDLSGIFQALLEDRIDLLLTNIGEDADLRNFQVQQLQTWPAMVVVAETHPWADRQNISAEDLRRAPMLQFRRIDRPIGHSFYHELGNMAVKTVSDFDTMLATLERGEHFAVFPQSYDYHERSRFKYLELPAEMRFAYHTVLLAKATSPKTGLNALLARFATCD